MNRLSIIYPNFGSISNNLISVAFSKKKRLIHIKKFIEIALISQSQQISNENEDDFALNIAKEAFELSVDDPKSRRHPISERFALPDILTNCLKIALIKDNDDLADQIVDFCRENSEEVSGQLNDECLLDYLKVKVENGEREKSLKCVLYAANGNAICASDLANLFIGSFDVQEKEAAFLNQMFSHDPNWKNIVIDSEVEQ